MEITISQLCSRTKFSISSSSLLCLNGNSKRNLNGGAVSVNYLKETEQQVSNISFTAKKKPRSHAPVVRTARASLDEDQSPTSGAGGERWLLQPVGKAKQSKAATILVFKSFLSLLLSENLQAMETQDTLVTKLKGLVLSRSLR